jgi:PAS domain S-box-containing protein
MVPKEFLYMLPFLVPLVITFMLTILAFYRRAVPGAVELGIIFLTTSLSSAFLVYELLSHTLQDQYFWDLAQYLCQILIPFEFLLFVNRYTHRPPWRLRHWLTAGFLPAFLVLGEVVALFRDGERPAFFLAQSAHLPQLSSPHNWFDSLATVYIYTYVLYGLFLLLKYRRGQPAHIRSQVVYIILWIIIPIIGVILSFTNLSYFGQHDFTPLSITIASLLLAWGLLRTSYFDVIPIARKAVMDYFTDPVLVLDRQDILIDANPAAAALLGLEQPGLPGKALADLLPELAAGLYSNEQRLVSELCLHGKAGDRYFDVNSTPLYHRGRLSGRLLILQDITPRRREAEALLQVQDILEQRVLERTIELEDANVRLEKEVLERTQAEQEKAVYLREMEILYQLALELVDLPSDANLWEVIAHRIRNHTGAFFAATSEYLPQKKAVVLRGLAGENSVLERASQLVGSNFLHMAYSISPERYRLLTEQVVLYYTDMSQATDGQIPPSVGRLMTSLFGVESLVYITILDQGVLIGAVILAQMKGKPSPSSRFLHALAHTIALSFHRRRADLARMEGETRFQQMAELLPQAIFECDLEGTLLYANRRAFEQFGIDRSEPGINVMSLVDEKDQEMAYQNFAGLVRSKQSSHNEYLFKRMDGSRFPGVVYASPLLVDDRSNGMRGVIVDISDIRQAEEERRRSEVQLHTVVDQLPVVLFAADRQGIFTLSEGRGLASLGLQPGQVVGLSVFDFYRGYPVIIEAMQGTLNGQPQQFLVTVSGVIFYTQVDPVRDASGEVQGLIGVAYDVTERTQAEESLRLSEEKYRTIIEQSSEGFLLVNDEGLVLELNQAFERITGLSRQEVLGQTYWDLTLLVAVNPDELRGRMDQLKGRYQALLEQAQKAPLPPSVITIQSRDGQPRILHQQLFLVRVTGQVRLAATLRDITEQKQAETDLQRLNRSLRLTSRCNLNLVRAVEETELFNDFCQGIVEEGGYRFAWISTLVASPDAGLAPAACFGDGGKALNCHLAASHSGAIDCHPVSMALKTLSPVLVAAVGVDERCSSCWEALKETDFVSLLALPLVHEGEKFGCLVVVSNRGDSFDEPDQRLLAEIAADLSFGIHTLRLRAERRLTLELLERSNLDLEAAYDATLEGWAQALELRERETAGHSRRVVDMTLRLAVSLGVPEVELLHLRRGALLHDIGKMGIPDGILLKPGPLTSDEWVVMRQHPLYAHRLLAGIAYLEPALDIPYYHHERWDGSGYPQRLVGEAIPLAARLFAVVDVWDALTEDRPYRPAWPQNAACEYLREQAGVLFDPQVVAAFLPLLDDLPEA